MTLAPLLLLQLLACAPHVETGLRRAELRWVERALDGGEVATANQALVGLTMLGPAALTLLPQVLERAAYGDLDPNILAASLEAMGEGVVPELEPLLLKRPPWQDAGLEALARLGPSGAAALIRLSQDRDVGDQAFERLRVMVGWAQHAWVLPGQRQRHPYIVPAAMFTPLDLATQREPILELSCALLARGRAPSRDRAVDIILSLDGAKCTLPWLTGADPTLLVAAVDTLPRRGPGLALAMAEVWRVLRKSPELDERMAASDSSSPAAAREARQLAAQRNALLAHYLIRLPDETPGREALLVDLLAHGSESTREALLRQLSESQRPSPAIVSAVVERLREDPELGDRVLALNRLCTWRVTEPDVLELMLHVGAERDGDIALVLGSFELLAAERPAWVAAAATDRSRPLSQRVLAALALPEPRVPALQDPFYEALRSGSPELKLLAIRGLVPSALPDSYQPDPRRGPALRAALLGDPDIGIQNAAAAGLAQLAQAGQLGRADCEGLRTASRLYAKNGRGRDAAKALDRLRTGDHPVCR